MVNNGLEMGTFILYSLWSKRYFKDKTNGFERGTFNGFERVTFKGFEWAFKRF